MCCARALSDDNSFLCLLSSCCVLDLTFRLSSSSCRFFSGEGNSSAQCKEGAVHGVSQIQKCPRWSDSSKLTIEEAPSAVSKLCITCAVHVAFSMKSGNSTRHADICAQVMLNVSVHCFPCTKQLDCLKSVLPHTGVGLKTNKQSVVCAHCLQSFAVH